MKLKDNSVKPEFSVPMLLGIIVANDVYREHGVNMVITSGKDGNHSLHSLHNAGNGADLRTWSIDPQAVAKGIRDRLNHHYDVVVEDTHIHLEYQPRTT